MNTCHFGGEIKADSSTDIAWEGGASYQDNSIGKMHKVQERRCATPTPLKIGIGYRFTYCFARLEDREPKVLERSDKKVVKMVKAIAKRKALVLLWAQDKGLGGLGGHY